MEHLYHDANNNPAPPNLRSEFEVADTNLKSNHIEEVTKYSMYEERPYIPAQDPRGVNVVERIKEGVPYVSVEDDHVTMDQLMDELENFECDCEGSGESGGSSTTPGDDPLDPDGDGVIDFV